MTTETTNNNNPTFEDVVDDLPPFEILAELENGMKLVKIHVDDLREQDVNARTMTNDMFQQLADNIRKTGTLKSLPLCVVNYENSRVEIISGHHRVRAARAAMVEKINVLLYSRYLTRDEIIAKQLAHNSISGKDDPDIVKQLFEQITDAEAKLEAYVDPKELDIPEPEKYSIDNITTDVEFRDITCMFLPHQLEKFEQVQELIESDSTLYKKMDMIAVADHRDWAKFKEALAKTTHNENIVAAGMVISKMCDIVLDHYQQREQELEEAESESYTMSEHIEN